MERAVGGVAGQVVVVAGVVVAGAAAVVAERADDRQVVRLLRQVRQVLAELDAGALVATGLKLPRYSAGASGFMSQVSMCDAPPLSQIMIADFAALRRGRRRGAGRAVRQVEPEEAQPAGDEEGAAVERQIACHAA